MTGDSATAAAESADILDQLGAEQVDKLFKVVRLAVGSAVLGAVSLSFLLIRFERLAIHVGVLWCLAVALCAAAHVALRAAYLRSSRRCRDWRRWGNAFAAIALAEGFVWGWAAAMLARHERIDARFLVLVCIVAMAAGSVSAFSTYLPAFAAFFLPTTIAYAAITLLETTGLEWASGVLMVFYIFGIGGLAFASNRQVHQLILLRLETGRLAEALGRQKEKAEEANRAKSSFLAAASHDLRQPVHALGLFVGALRTMPMPPEALRLVEQIDLSSQAMDSLFAALLDISRLDAGIVEVHKRSFAIEGTLARICAEHGAEAAAKSLTIRHPRCGAHVFNDPILVERVLRNLVSNAVRYTERGRVLIGCRRRGDAITVQVWDTGPGIPAGEQERIFQEYFQLGNAERDRAKGLGLGLAIVRRLTNLLEVPLRLRATPGRGSCFEFDLPLAGQPSPDEEASIVEQAFAPAKRRLIVVIDDEAQIRAAMASVLAGWGHEVVVAGSGDEAMALLADLPRRPDLILCDLRLSAGETGTVTIELLRTEYNEAIPAILVTGDTAPDRLLEAKASGLLVLHKPVANARLRAAIANVVAHADRA